MWSKYTLRSVTEVAEDVKALQLGQWKSIQELKYTLYSKKKKKTENILKNPRKCFQPVSDTTAITFSKIRKLETQIPHLCLVGLDYSRYIIL